MSAERRKTEERVIGLLVMFERMSNEYRRAHAYHEITAEPMFGPRYARLVEHGPEGYGNPCIGFVNMENGDILYPKGWAGPTKLVRGNVWAEDYGLSAFRWHGVARADEMPRKP